MHEIFTKRNLYRFLINKTRFSLRGTVPKLHSVSEKNTWVKRTHTKVLKLQETQNFKKTYNLKNSNLCSCLVRTMEQMWK